MCKAILVCAALAALTLGSGVAAAQAPAKTCDGADYRAFDFWVGEWDAYVTGGDRLAGRSSIRREDGGCVITEHWRSRRSAYSGRSLNIFDRPSGRWVQVWMDSTGDMTRFAGGSPAPGRMTLVAEDDVSPADPTPRWQRLTFTANPDGSVRQVGETSADRGASWSPRYDFTYRPAKREDMTLVRHQKE